MNNQHSISYGYGYNAPISPVSEESSSGGSWAGAIALFLVILLIIALIIYVAINGTQAITKGPFTWNIVDSTATGATATFTADAGDALRIPSTSNATTIPL